MSEYNDINRNNIFFPNQVLPYNPQEDPENPVENIDAAAIYVPPQENLNMQLQQVAQMDLNLNPFDALGVFPVEQLGLLNFQHVDNVNYLLEFDDFESDDDEEDFEVPDENVVPMDEEVVGNASAADESLHVNLFEDAMA